MICLIQPIGLFCEVNTVENFPFKSADVISGDEAYRIKITVTLDEIKVHHTAIISRIYIKLILQISRTALSQLDVTIQAQVIKSIADVPIVVVEDPAP